MTTREEHVASLMDRTEVPIPTQAANDEAVAHDSENWAETDSSQVLDQDELGGPSQLVDLSAYEEDSPKHEEEEAQAGEQETAGSEEGAEAGEGQRLSLWETQALQRSAYAAERERDRLRELNRNNKARIERLEGMVGEVTTQLRDAAAEQPPEGMENDPYARYWNERIGKLETAAEPTEQEGPSLEEIQETRRFAQESAHELRIRMPEGQFDEAYQFARNKLAEQTGLSGEQFNIYEQGLIWQMKQEGGDPAIEAIKYAESHGWRQNGAPPAPAPAPDQQERQPNPAIPQRQVRRMRRGVDQNAVAESTTVHVGRSGTMSLENFYERYDEGERKAIFAKYPDAFSDLALKKSIPTRFLPKDQ